MVRAFRFLAGIIALSALVLQFWLMTKYPSSPGIRKSCRRSTAALQLCPKQSDLSVRCSIPSSPYEPPERQLGHHDTLSSRVGDKPQAERRY